uniref:Uncharacterized protein n=1 Tax=Heterosigma akashiwo TaxID=2829 RepID=A0A7S3XM67_HETAK
MDSSHESQGGGQKRKINRGLRINEDAVGGETSPDRVQEPQENPNKTEDPEMEGKDIDRRSPSPNTKAAAASLEKQKKRGDYRCSRCGVPKKGHVCPYQIRFKKRDQTQVSTQDAACQVELDEGLVCRMLDLGAQGLAVTYCGLRVNTTHGPLPDTISATGGPVPDDGAVGTSPGSAQGKAPTWDWDQGEKADPGSGVGVQAGQASPQPAVKLETGPAAMGGLGFGSDSDEAILLMQQLQALETGSLPQPPPASGALPMGQPMNQPMNMAQQQAFMFYMQQQQQQQQVCSRYR